MTNSKNEILSTVNTLLVDNQHMRLSALGYPYMGKDMAHKILKRKIGSPITTGAALFPEVDNSRKTITALRKTSIFQTLAPAQSSFGAERLFY